MAGNLVELEELAGDWLATGSYVQFTGGDISRIILPSRIR
jgi:hypothetical protein